MSKGALGLLAAYWPEDTPRYAHIPLKTIGEVTIYPIAGTSPNRVALASAGGSLTYGELSAKARSFGDSLRNRVQRGSRVAIVAAGAAEMLIALFGAFEADVLAFLHVGSPPKEVLDVFVPELVIGDNLPAGVGTRVSFGEMMTGPGKPRSGRADFRTPVLAMAMPDLHGEALHSHRTLVATAISIGGFYLLAEEITVLLLEPPTNWCTLAMLLGALQRGATVWAGWEGNLEQAPSRLDYAVCRWEQAGVLLDESQADVLTGRIAAGLIAGIERPFSTSRRLRLSRKIRADVLTLLGRNDLGPIIGSHPAWFLNDAAGIPLPNVDLRPLNPTDGAPLNIGWEVVDSAELGVKSALAPVGGAVVQGWLRSGLIAQIDPTGFYFLLRDSRLRTA